jgi:tRNA-2-methylthio-N6-dimethylallyladenosine synthase
MMKATAMAQLKIADKPIDLIDLIQNKNQTSHLEGEKGQADDLKIYIETYGCQMNVADSELMGGIMMSHGYSPAQSIDEADVILVNTCAVREKAEERVFGRVATLSGHKKKRKGVVLGVCGCMAEHLKAKISERAPEVDLVIGPDAYRRLPELISRARSADNFDPIVDVRLDRRETYEGITPARQEGVSGWVTIQRGCDKFCTFCIVPYTRGRERGVSPREILRQAHQLAGMGTKEITLLGQTVNSYVYEGVDFADLLRSVAQIDGIERVRFTSPYPVDYTPKLIEVMASTPKVSKYIHLPVQSGSDDVLKNMRRGYTVGEFRKLVGDLRASIPDIAMSTDIIVGFPGETESDHAQTLELVEEVRFDFAYMFKYSEREGTYAHKRIDDDIPEATKGRRLREVISLQESICAQLMTKHVGKTFNVLIEGDSKKSADDWVGRTDTFKSVIFPKRTDTALGQIVPVRVLRNTSHTLIGEIE